MTVDHIRKLFDLILEEIESNPKLARKIEGLLKTNSTIPSNSTKSTKTSPAKTKRKRAPALLDPIGLIEKSESDLRTKLSELTVDQLKDIVSEYGMDPSKLVMKWRKPDRLINHIVETSSNRCKKGDAFRKE